MDPLLLLVVVLVLIWALGMGTAYTVGGLIHALLLVAVIILVIRLAAGRSL